MFGAANGRKGRRRAVVVVAPKLAVLLHCMWADVTEFRQDQVVTGYRTSSYGGSTCKRNDSK